VPLLRLHAVPREHPQVRDSTLSGQPRPQAGIPPHRLILEPGVADIGEGDIIGVQRGTTGKAWAEDNLVPQGAEIRTFQGAPAAFQDLAAGGVTAVVNDEPSSAEIITDLPGLEVVEAIDTDEKYGFAFSPENPELTDAMNQVLAEVIADGTYQEIFQRYFPGVEVPPEFQPS
jgi:polar amino acid transport system substrate-binding protein